MIAQRLQESLRFWWQYLAALLLVTAPFAVSGEFVQWGFGPALSADESGLHIGHLSALLLLLLRPFAEGAVMAQLVAIEGGRPRGLGDCLMFCVRAAPTLLVTFLFLGVLVYLGLMLLIFPGVWLYARLCQAPFIAVLEGRTPVQALQESFRRTQADQWQILLAVTLAYMMVLLVTNTFGVLVLNLLGDQKISTLLIALATSLLSAMPTVLIFRYYGLHRPSAPPTDNGHG